MKYGWDFRFLFLVASSLLALSVGSCSNEAPKSSIGKLVLPLRMSLGDTQYRFLGTIEIYKATDEIGEDAPVKTIVTDESSPDEHTVSLPEGQYKIHVVSSPDAGTGYHCTITPPNPDFTGCTYVDYSPESFVITADSTTDIELTFTFHIDQDVKGVFRSGEARIVLVPEVEDKCGDDLACVEEEQLCVSIDSAEPACATVCTEDEESCEAGDACFPVAESSEKVCAATVVP